MSDNPNIKVSAYIEDTVSEAAPQTIVVVTRFDRFQAEPVQSNEAGITVRKLTSDSTHSSGTILFLPWHQIDHLVLSTPEGAMSDDHTFPGKDDTSTIMTRSGAV